MDPALSSPLVSKVISSSVSRTGAVLFVAPADDYIAVDSSFPFRHSVNPTEGGV
jgi:hypothetical protein